MSRVIQLHRQGVSDTLRAWFGPCEHGESWHFEMHSYQGKFYVAEVSFPNCHTCFGPKAPKPELDTENLTNESYSAWERDSRNWAAQIRSGQIAWTSYGKAKPIHISAAMNLALPEIQRLTGQRWTFSERVEAYCCYSEADYMGYPRLRDDVFLACASYEPQTNTIRHEPSNICLVAFDGPEGTAAHFHVDAAAKPYRKQVALAYKEYRKSHVQRDPQAYARTWFAWLLSEYIKELPGEKPVVRERMIRS